MPRIRKETRANAKAYKKDATLLLRATEGRVETNHRNPISETVSTDNGDITFHFLAGEDTDCAIAATIRSIRKALP